MASPRKQNKAPSRPAKGGKMFHYLIAGSVMFTADSKEGVGSHNFNVMVTNERPFVTANMIGLAQQRAQLELFQLVGDPSIKMLAVHITSVNYLGEMSKEEFYTAPPEAAPEADGAPAAAAVAPLAPVAINDEFSTAD